MYCSQGSCPYTGLLLLLLLPSLLSLQVPWTYLTYQQGPAVRLAAQLSSGLFPFVIMGLVGHAFECS
jgi:hypothetical protein